LYLYENDQWMHAELPLVSTLVVKLCSRSHLGLNTGSHPPMRPSVIPSPDEPKSADGSVFVIYFAAQHRFTDRMFSRTGRG
jgi:hypothetical protein